MTIHERSPPLPPWVHEAVQQACDRHMVGGVPGYQFMIVREPGEEDVVRHIGRPAATSRRLSYIHVMQKRVIYALCQLGMGKGRAKEVWADVLQHLEVPRHVNNKVGWYVEYYYRSNTGM